MCLKRQQRTPIKLNRFCTAHVFSENTTFVVKWTSSSWGQLDRPLPATEKRFPVMICFNFDFVPCWGLV